MVGDRENFLNTSFNLKNPGIFCNFCSYWTAVTSVSIALYRIKVRFELSAHLSGMSNRFSSVHSLSLISSRYGWTLCFNYASNILIGKRVCHLINILWPIIKFNRISCSVLQLHTCTTSKFGVNIRICAAIVYELLCKTRTCDVQLFWSIFSLLSVNS